MMLRHTVATFGLFSLLGCALPTAEEDAMRNKEGQELTRSMTTVMNCQSRQRLPNLQVNNLEPGEYTIQLGLMPPAPDPITGTPQTVAVNAIINWKVDGQPQRRVVSVLPGMSITGVAEAVDVQFQDLGTLLGTNIAGAEYKVAATLSRGSRANIQQPPVLYSEIPTTLNASNHNFLVPENAGVVAFYPFIAQLTPGAAVLVPGSIEISQFTNGTIVGMVTPLNSIGSWVPLLPGVTSVRITNFAASDVLASVVWGVEG